MKNNTGSASLTAHMWTYAAQPLSIGHLGGTPRTLIGRAIAHAYWGHELQQQGYYTRPSAPLWHQRDTELLTQDQINKNKGTATKMSPIGIGQDT